MRVVYCGDNFGVKMRLVADDYEVHPYIAKPSPPRPIEFDVPYEATRDGNLTLAFTQELGRGGNGRGCQVGEVWLVKKTE